MREQLPTTNGWQRLRAETFVQGMEFREELGSTNTLALELGTQDVRLPHLIWAQQQTTGRGRGLNHWWSGPGSLTCSLLLEPEQFGIPRERWPALSLCVGTAVCHALQCLQVSDVALKWPNDVYVDSKKICGILIESVPTRPERLVIGIGLNVNNSFVAAPSDVQLRATSLHDVLQTELQLEDVLILLLRELEQFLVVLGARPLDLPPLWRSLCWLSGQVVTISDVRGETTGLVLGIDDAGALRLQTAQGVQRILSGTVTVQTPSE